jgi:hypothetical protein
MERLLYFLWLNFWPLRGTPLGNLFHRISDLHLLLRRSARGRPRVLFHRLFDQCHPCSSVVRFFRTAEIAGIAKKLGMNSFFRSVSSAFISGKVLPKLKRPDRSGLLQL